MKTSAGQSSIWQRVQAGDDAAGLARRNTEEDDGSGAAWVKRRREQREREKKEREAAKKRVQAEAHKMFDDITAVPSRDAAIGSGSGTSKKRKEVPVVAPAAPVAPKKAKVGENKAAKGFDCHQSSIRFKIGSWADRAALGHRVGAQLVRTTTILFDCVLSMPL